MAIEGIKTLVDLERMFGVGLGDLVVCTFEEGSSLDLLCGLYNPYQGVVGREILDQGVVDFRYGAKQKYPLCKSEDHFRIHLGGHGWGDKIFIGNNDRSNQVNVAQLRNFRVVLKSQYISEFYDKIM